MDKKTQRRFCLSARAKLNPTLRQEYSRIICYRLLKLDLKGNIFSYFPFNDEVDITSFNRINNVSYPVISADRMMDAYLAQDDSFIINRYGIYEPDITKAIKIDKEDISHIIIPCVGFDEDHYRIGYGGGYYDRYLKDVKATKIGVAFDIQKIDKVIHSDHDIRLDCIVTETKIY